MREGRRPPTYDLEMAKRLFLAMYDDLVERGYFAELTGYECIDQGPFFGTAGTDVASFVFRRTLRENLWPVQTQVASWSEDALMDAIEFLYDHVSEPAQPRPYHDWNSCGYHDREFDKRAGQVVYRVDVNDVIRLLDGGWELTAEGEVVRRVDSEVHDLIDRSLPPIAGPTAQGRVDAATRKFRSRSSNWDDRRDAVRDLADALELLRPQLKKALTKKDDALLFDMVNNFGIRHLNERQHTEYDESIWLSWMFHFLLATIHAGTRFLAVADERTAAADKEASA
jgi:hypothetical protein